jgi:hypothetical protein
MLNFEAIFRYKTATQEATLQAKGRMSLPQDATAKRRGLNIDELRWHILQRYSKNGGLPIVTAIGDNWITATVKNLRREVITDKNYWERLQIVVLLEKEAVGLKVHLILDGRYAGGIAVPNDHAYSDMEPAYTSYLLDYGKTLLLALMEGKSA